MKKENYTFSLIRAYTYNELADQINAHAEVICLEGEILKDLYKKLNDEIIKNKRRLGFKALMGSLAVLSILSLNPLLIAGAFSSAISSILSTDKDKIRDFKEYSAAIFRDSNDNKRLLLIYEASFDGSTDSIRGFEDYYFFSSTYMTRKFQCECGKIIDKCDFDEETNRYYCSECNHYLVSRISLKQEMKYDV